MRAGGTATKGRTVHISDRKKLEKVERKNLKVARYFLKVGFFLRSLPADKGFVFLSQSRKAFGFSQGVSNSSPIFSRSLKVFSRYPGKLKVQKGVVHIESESATLAGTVTNVPFSLETKRKKQKQSYENIYQRMTKYEVDACLCQKPEK